MKRLFHRAIKQGYLSSEPADYVAMSAIIAGSIGLGYFATGAIIHSAVLGGFATLLVWGHSYLTRRSRPIPAA